MMKILLVDDSLTVLSRYGRMLREEGYEVLSTPDPDEALALAREHLPDIAIVDYHMPEMTGDELTHRLLADPRTSEIMVMMFSMDDGAVHAALGSGAIDLIDKDESPNTFLKRISAVARTIAVKKRSYDRLFDILQKVTDRLKTGIIVVNGDEARPFNGCMVSLAESYGGTDAFLAREQAVGSDLDMRFSIQRVALEPGTQLVLVQETG
jgi:CheY-like chemotaxis protein